MLFSITAQYTPQALKAMADNPDTNREAVVKQLLEAAGGTLISMYGTLAHGPGVVVVFDVPDPDMAGAMCGTAVAGGGVHNARLVRLYTMDEVKRIRQKRAQIAGAYKPPGQT
jgi:uncharacterized protein with GYD domain